MDSQTGEVTIVGAGTTTITASWKDISDNSLEKTYTLNVLARNVSKIAVSGYEVSYTYTGSAITIHNLNTFTMQDGKLLTTEDYTITYANNINVGEATME